MISCIWACDEHLRKVLRRLEGAHLTLNKEKCLFSKNKMEFLGQVVDGNSGVQPDPEKVAAIVDMPTPSNIGDIHQYLGVANQMSKFIPNLAEK